MSSLNELGIIPECDIARADERARQHAEIEALKAERDALRAELVEHNAARNAYASEFPPDHDGKHNVGIILLNIRNLKSERDALLEVLTELANSLPSAEYMRQQGQEEGPLLRKMRAVIAKVTGENK